MAKIDYQLFEADQHALDAAYGKCPHCDNDLVIKNSKKGTFLGCKSYPDCTHIQSLQNNEVTVITQIDKSECKECGNSLAVKKGKYGMFIGCMGFPECHFIASKNTTTSMATEENVPCPSCSTMKTQGFLIKRQNKFGKFFYPCSNYPKCKYMVNLQPVSKKCKQCGWPILVKKNTDSITLMCPQPRCDFTRL